MNCVLKGSFLKGKGQAMELSTTRVTFFFKDFLVIISTMDGELQTTTKDNGLQEKSMVMESIKATMQLGMLN
jgi:hypothetical protein